MAKKKKKKKPAITNIPQPEQVPEEKEKKSIKKMDFSIIAFLLIIVVGTIIYSNTFDSVFQWDDIPNILENKELTDISIFSSPSKWLDFNNRPFSLFTFSLNYYFSKFNVFSFHLVNLIIHLLTGWIIYLLVNFIFSMPLLKDDPISEYSDIFSLFVALIFVAHPIQTQAVTYIVQRMASLAALFYVMSVYFYAKGRLYYINNQIKQKFFLFYFLALLSGILALLSKQNAVTFPMAMLLFEFFFIRDKENKLFKNYLMISSSIIFFVVIIVITTFELPRETDEISRIEYLLTQFTVTIKYFQLLILPIGQNLDYDFPISKTLLDLRVLGSLTAILSVLILGAWLYGKNKIISFGIFWFFLTLSVESSIIPIQDVIFEHRLYLPMFGFSLCFVTLVFSLINVKRKKLLTAILSIIILFYGIATYSRNQIWKTRYLLWEDIVKKSPGKSRPNSNFGKQLQNKGKTEEALAHYQKALRIDKDYMEARYNLGLAYFRKGEHGKAVKNLKMIKPSWIAHLTNHALKLYREKKYILAIEYCNLVLKVQEENVIALHTLGAIDYVHGNTEKAMAYYKKVLVIDPNNVASIQSTAYALYRKGLIEKSVELYNKAITLEPDDENSLKNLGIIYLDSGNLDRAIYYLGLAVKSNPENHETLYKLAISWSRKGEYDKSLNYFDQVLEIKPNHIDSLNKIAMIWGAQGELDKAIEYFEKALQINPGSIETLNNLGIGWYKKGNYEKAIECFKKILEIDPAHAGARSNLTKVQMKLRSN